MGEARHVCRESEANQRLYSTCNSGKLEINSTNCCQHVRHLRGGRLAPRSHGEVGKDSPDGGGISMKNIIILSGWKVPSEKYAQLKSILESRNFNVYVPDLPGFGKSALKKESFTLDDYADFLHSYIKNHRLGNVVIVAHSFGGRMIVKYLHKYKQSLRFSASPAILKQSFSSNKKNSIKGIVLCGTPLVKEKLTVRKIVGKNIIYFASKASFILPNEMRANLRKHLRFLAYRLIREYDYYKAGNLKKTLVNVLSDDPERYITDIKVPTFILWGEDDQVTPVSIAKELHKLIKNCQLVIIPQATHKLPYEKPDLFAEEIIKFIQTLRA